MSELMQTTTAAKARIITAFMICALGICIWVLSTVDTSDLIAIDQPSMFLYGVFSQAAVYAVYILAWQVNLTQCAIPTVSYHNSVVHCGIAFLGKYIPGKLGGLILRGATIHTRTPSTGCGSVRSESRSVAAVGVVRTELIPPSSFSTNFR